MAPRQALSRAVSASAAMAEEGTVAESFRALSKVSTALLKVAIEVVNVTGVDAAGTLISSGESLSDIKQSVSATTSFRNPKSSSTRRRAILNDVICFI